MPNLRLPVGSVRAMRRDPPRDNQSTQPIAEALDVKWLRVLYLRSEGFILFTGPEARECS